MATPTRFPIMPGHRSSSTQCTLLKIYFSIFAKKCLDDFAKAIIFQKMLHKTSIFSRDLPKSRVIKRFPLQMVPLFLIWLTSLTFLIINLEKSYLFCQDFREHFRSQKCENNFHENVRKYAKTKLSFQPYRRVHIHDTTYLCKIVHIHDAIYTRQQSTFMTQATSKKTVHIHNTSYLY